MAGSNTEVVLGRVNEALGSFIDGFKEKQNDYSACFICHRERALYLAMERRLSFNPSHFSLQAAPLLLLIFKRLRMLKISYVALRRACAMQRPT